MAVPSSLRHFRLFSLKQSSSLSVSLLRQLFGQLKAALHGSHKGPNPWIASATCYTFATDVNDLASQHTFFPQHCKADSITLRCFHLFSVEQSSPLNVLPLRRVFGQLKTACYRIDFLPLFCTLDIYVFPLVFAMVILCLPVYCLC